MLLLATSFMAGVLTVLAPCVLPLLPIIIGSSISQNGKKSIFILIGSLALSVIFFTILLRASTIFITIPNYVWTLIAGIIITLFGVITLFPNVWENSSKAISNSSGKVLENATHQAGIKRDICIGLALGPVFTSCSPTYSLILATILPISFIQGVFYISIYTLGLASVLLCIALLGNKLTSKLRVIADPNSWFKKSLGVIFLIIGISIILRWDKTLEAFIIEQGYFGVTSFEENLVEKIESNQ